MKCFTTVTLCIFPQLDPCAKSRATTNIQGTTNQGINHHNIFVYNLTCSGHWSKAARRLTTWLLPSLYLARHPCEESDQNYNRYSLFLLYRLTFLRIIIRKLTWYASLIPLISMSLTFPPFEVRHRPQMLWSTLGAALRGDFVDDGPSSRAFCKAFKYSVVARPCHSIWSWFVRIVVLR